MSEKKYLAGVKEIDNPNTLVSQNAYGQFYVDIGKGTKETVKAVKAGGSNAKDKSKDERLEMSELKVFGSKVARRAGDNKRLLEIVGDFNSIIKLIVMGVVSPNTLERGEMRYSIEQDSTMEEPIRNAIIKTLQTYYDERYNITQDMEQDIREMLAGSGSVFKMVLPPDQIQAMILNKTEHSMESLQTGLCELADAKYWNEKQFIPKQLGVFATNDINATSMESLWSNSTITDLEIPVRDIYGCEFKAIDNTLHLRNGMLNEHLAVQSHAKRLEALGGLQENDGFSMEGIHKHTYTEGKENKFTLPVRTLKLKGKGKQSSGVEELGELDFEDLNIEESQVEYLDFLPVNHISLPPESVIVCHRKGNPTQRLGYIILLGDKSSPLTMNYDEATSRVRSARVNEPDASSNIIKRIRDDIYGSKTDYSEEQNLDTYHRKVLDYFKDKMSRFVNESLEAGIFGGLVDINTTDEVALNAFYQAMDEKGVNLLFVPDSQMQHFAFEYDEYGAGKTIFDDARTLFNMKAALIHTQAYSATVSARPVKDVTIKIDPDDPNPKKEMLKRVEELLRAEGNAMPWADISKSNLERNAVMSGMNINFEGNDRLPQSSTKVTEGRREAVKVDSETITLINDMCYKSIGWSEDVVNWFKDAELATSVISNNLQIARRIHFYQSVYLKHHINLAKRTIPLDGEFAGRIIRELEEIGPKGKRILKAYGTDTRDQLTGIKGALKEWVNDISFDLPKPDSSVLKAKREELEEFISMLDVVLEGYVVEDMFDGTDELRNQIRGYKSMIRAGAIRQFNTSHDSVPELASIFDDKGNAALTQEHNDFLDRLSKDVISAMKRLKESDLDLTSELTEVENAFEEEKRKKEEEDAAAAAALEEEENPSDELDPETPPEGEEPTDPESEPESGPEEPETPTEEPEGKSPFDDL